MRINLTEGFYETRGLLAAAQRILNLYPEINPQDATGPVTHYPTPGKTLLASIGNGPIRGAYTATNGALYVASGNGLYAVSDQWLGTLLGTLTTSVGPVSMKDNGATLVGADGSATGFRVTLASNAFSQITSATDSNWRPAGRVDYLDGWLICNEVDSPRFFISDIQAGTFTNALYFASKEGNSDKLVTQAVMHREIWLLGQDTTEVWFDSGAQDFPFQRMPGVFIQQGCAAAGSVATWDLSLFWLGRNPQGQYVVFRGAGYQAQRISTHAIEEVISGYGTVSDAVGFCYQQEGHAFYQLSFPSADATWVYDMATGKWHERGALDTTGVIHRDSANCHAFAYGVNVVGDAVNGNLYQLDQGNFTDNGNPVLRLRSFPTLDLEDRRVLYGKLTLDMLTGVGLESGLWESPVVFVRWSDDGGYTWSEKVEIPLGGIGAYNTRAVLWRSGYGRRRVFEVSWASPLNTALQGAWLDAKPLSS